MNTQNNIAKSKEAVDEASQRVSTELRAELDNLNRQVEKLAGELSRLGRSGVRAARVGATEGLDALARTRDDITDIAGRELAHVEDRAAAAVRERPVQTLGLAVVMGFLIAIFMRR
jgi:ElaB/YqjD/DUF883 family membrane-anchored ribosome-binding protein